MQMEIKITACPYQDKELLNTFSHAQELYAAVHDIREKLHARLSGNVELEEDEEEFLRELIDHTFIEMF